MVDIELHRPVKVHRQNDAGPSITIPLEQLPDIRRVLERNGIAYTISPDAIKLDESKPFIAIVNFGRNVDPDQVQAALDAG